MFFHSLSTPSVLLLLYYTYEYIYIKSRILTVFISTHHSQTVVTMLTNEYRQLDWQSQYNFPVLHNACEHNRVLSFPANNALLRFPRAVSVRKYEYYMQCPSTALVIVLLPGNGFMAYTSNLPITVAALSKS